jgi:hypothetical protein
MGTITRSFANNLTTGGVLKADAFNNASLNNVTALNAAIATGGMVLVSSATASSSASIEFTLGNYKEYQFYFVNIHPDADRFFKFNFSTDSGSTYSVSKTTTFFKARHFESDGGYEFGYEAGYDLANSTADQTLTEGTQEGTDNDASLSGYMSLFNPSSATYVKHFVANIQQLGSPSGRTTFNNYVAGYANTTSALTNIKFVMTSGTIDDGTILMYGIN